MDKIDILYREVIAEAKAIKIPISDNINKSVVINTRAKSRFGCCKKIKSGFRERFEIELSNRLIDCKPMVIKQTLAHELMHTCPGCANHGELWKKYCKKMNEAYGYNIKRTDTAEQLGIAEKLDSKQIELKENYIVICKKCGNKVARTRMSNVIKHPSLYRCKCGGKLERIK
ncbi:MAG: SprT-like domain-containing protein [Aminipila sp.]